MSEYLNIEQYLPHRTPMLLLDKVIFVDDEKCSCSVIVKKGGRLDLFLDSNGNLPNYIAVELMAQTIGVYSGYHMLNASKPIGLGMIIGGRSIDFKISKFHEGSNLVITMLKLVNDGRFASFSGTVTLDNRVVGEGRINTFKAEPDEIKKLIDED